MKLNIQKPRNFINPLLSRKSVDENTFIAFKTNIEEYKHKLDEQLKTKQTEPNIVTNALKPFVDSFGYQGEPYSQKGQISIDLAIMQGITPTVLIEAKMPNSNDMITEGDLNKKSFHQAVLYFMNERVKNNKTLFHIIITDFNNWFIFDAKDFDRLFWNNSRIRKLHEALITQALLGDRTEDFYSDLAKELPNLKKDLFEPELIDCAHFNIRLKSNEKELTAIYKLLSADCLLKAFNPNDANSLNKEFYNELLYILGLEETKENGKKIIGRAKKPQSGTLYENISNKLGQYQKNNDFESVIKLIIIWINRILFLKLLESQIVKWSGTQKFLSPKTLDQYDQLETLFFDVLAKPIKSRSVREYDHVPYLNSSLFEIHPDERAGITIATMADNIEIDYYAKTVVKDESNHRKTGKISALPYLLSFLDAYDFANDSDEELTNTHKTLISASVLGLIFEKINGYKDGSFYTPSFITMYMAHETIEKTVIEKFNQIKGWQCKTLTDVINKDYELVEANNIINGIKICDPAVGSGHFLVSALNELLRIKSDLGVLVDSDGKRIKDYALSVENDELIIMSDEGEQFEYKKGSAEKTRIQKTLFKEKQILIENCLFGVDINPNSVNICRLRLWVELLKNAYYQENGELDTLPNIDINIKCGNSLISRFGLTGDLKSKTIKAEIQDYKAKVKQYKENVGSKQDVLQAINAIKTKFQVDLKASHKSTVEFQKYLREFVREYDYDGLNKELSFIAFNLNLPRATVGLFESAIDEKAKVKKLEEIVTAYNKVKEIESGKIYQNAFEWRFEFPEVLNEHGEFVGFDVVIGNPPYIKEDKNKSAFDGLHEKRCYQGKTDIWHLFTDQALDILKQNGLVSFIAKNQWMESISASKMRKAIYEKSEIKSIIDFGTNMVFDEAGQQTMIFLLQKNTSNLSHDINYKKYISKLNNIEIAKLIDTSLENEHLKMIQKTICKQYDELANLTFSNVDNEALLLKIEALRNFEFNEAVEIAQGIIGGPDEAFIIDEKVLCQFNDSEKKFIKMLHTSTERWCTPNSKEYIFYISAKNFSGKTIDDFPNIKNTFHPYEEILKKAKIEYKSPKKPYFYLHRERDEKFFVGGERLVFAARTIGRNFSLSTEPFYGSRNLFFIKSERVSLKFILGILNSKLMSFYMHQRLKHTGELLQIDKNQFMRIPFYLPSEAIQKAFVEKVNEIIQSKRNGIHVDGLEAQLDDMVHELYQLTPEEIAIITSDQVIMPIS